MIGIATSRKKIREVEEAAQKKAEDERTILEKAKAEADKILAEAKEHGEQKRDAMVLEAEARAKLAESRIQEADAHRKAAEVEAKELVLKAKDEAEKERTRLLSSAEARSIDLEKRAAKRDDLIREKETLLTNRELELTKRESGVQAKEQAVKALETKADELVQAREATLQQVANMTADEARKQLIERYIDEARRGAANDAKRIEDETRLEAEKKAKRVIGLAIQRYAGEYVQDRSVTSVHLPNDELKGRIIGREGRNIRALQEATGVDFIVDDTPETIVVSSFDPVRREAARIALEKLIADGRIHPTRIEEVVQKAHAEVERSMQEAAEQAMAELSVTRVHPELIKLLGRLRFRYSYAQNVLRHSVEAGFLCGLMAAELGLNVRQARRAGLLHDIGKAVSHEQEGGHAIVGGQLARKFGEDEVVANAIACHHNDEPCNSVLGHLVTAADTLSGARPGARREMLESYIQRLHELEQLSSSFNGVERAYAIQAGREIRVLVEPAEVSDAESAILAREIARRVEDSLSYPGQIRVTVVRETRAVDYAK